MPAKSTDAEAKEIAKKYGEDADLYAETRAEAAAEAGRKRSADHWEEVSEEVKNDGDEASE